MDNTTPLQALMRGYADAAERLRVCLLTPEPAEMERLLNEVFGPKSLDLFRRNGTIDRAVIQKILDALLIDACKFIEFVDIDACKFIEFVDAVEPTGLRLG